MRTKSFHHIVAPFLQDRRPWWIRNLWTIVIALVLIGWFSLFVFR